MVLSKLIYSIKDAVKEFNDDTVYSNRYINYLIDVKRAKYVRQNIDKYGAYTDNNLIQKLCVKLEEVDKFDCVDVECKHMLKSVKQIPQTFMTATKSSIISVSPKDNLSQSFEVIDSENLHLIKHSQFKNKIYYFLSDDNYLYLYSANNIFKEIDCITVRGVFESTSDLSEFSSSCSDSTAEPCFSYEIEYPVQSHLIDAIRTEVIKDLLLGFQIKEDIDNDSKNK